MTSISDVFDAAPALLFDMDGTMAATWEAYRRAGRIFLTTHKQLLKPEWKIKLFEEGRLTDKKIRHFYYIPSGDQVLDYFMGHVDREAMRAEAGRLCAKNKEHIQVFPAFYPLLRLCENQGKKIGMITNADRGEVEVVLERAREDPLNAAYGLDDRLKDMPFVATENMPPKPNRAPLEAFERRHFRLTPGWIYAGDEDTDTQFARNVGAISVRLGEDGPRSKPDFYFASLEAFYKGISARSV